jgi:hypothetical protein
MKLTLKLKPPSKEVKQAVRTIRAEHLAHELRVRFNPARTFEPSPEFEHAKRLLDAEIAGRLFALYDFFSINPTSPEAGVTLALVLACEYVPGFNVLDLERRGDQPPETGPGRMLVDSWAVA